MRFLAWPLAVFCAAVSFTAAAQVNLAGVKFDPETTVGSQKLQLNGAGIRYKAMFKVYAVGLYAPKKATRNEDVLDLKMPKRLQLVALRDVSGDEFGRLFTRAVEENASREEFSKSINEVIRMGEIFSTIKQFGKGDVVQLDYIPSTGLAIILKGKQQGDTFKGPLFSTLMYKIWFGPHPPDTALQKALLGEQNYTNQ